MSAPRPLRLAPEWDDRFGRMLGVSALAHGVLIAAAVLLPGRGGALPLPLVAYTVELTDPAALGGRVPPGAPGPDLTGGAAQPVPSAPAGGADPVAGPAEEAKAEPKAEDPKPPEVIPEPKKPEPPPLEAKKPEPAKAEPPKPEPPRVDRPKPAPAKPEPPKAAARAEPKPTAEVPKPGPVKSSPPRAAAKEEGAPRDAYAAAADRWKSRAGGGLGGAQDGSGPIGAGGEGSGGGGQLVGLEFIAYREQVRNLVKAQWTHLAQPGRVATVRFEISPDGQVSNIRLAQGSGDAAYDSSVLRAVQHTSQLPPPPARYVNEFREFMIEFHSEETGGQGAG